MIDLSTLKEGDTVKFRAGGEAVVDYGFHVDVEWFYWERLSWKHNGHHQCGISDTPFDIVEIIAKPFNWDDVKNGDAFVDDLHEDVVYYIGRDYTDSDWVVCKGNARDGCTNGLFFHTKSTLTRAPKHDIEVWS